MPATIRFFAETPAVFAHSSSSFIFDSKTDTCLKGEGGHHGYVFVQDARDIPRAGKVLLRAIAAEAVRGPRVCAAIFGEPARPFAKVATPYPVSWRAPIAP